MYMIQDVATLAATTRGSAPGPLVQAYVITECLTLFRTLSSITITHPIASPLPHHPIMVGRLGGKLGCGRPGSTADAD